MKYFTACLVLLCVVQVLAHSDGDVKLVDGDSRSSGLVKMFYQGEWGTMCDDGFDVQVARVICRSAGFSDSRPTRATQYIQIDDLPSFDADRGRILLDRVRCTGNESNVMQCAHSAVGETNDCIHLQDIAVDCYGKDIGSSVELRDGTAKDGVLVLNHSGFRTVCDLTWNDEDYAIWNHGRNVVACRMLGVNTSILTPIQVNRTYYGETTDLPHLSLLRMQCHGNETNLTECNVDGDLFLWRAFQLPCRHSDEIALDCLGSANVDVALINGNATAGEVQVSYRGESGAVCADYSDRPNYYAYTAHRTSERNAKVYCRMLGYGDHEGVVLDARELTEGRKIKLPYVYCDTGNERNIAECTLVMQSGGEWCDEVLAIECRPQPDIAVRLVDGNETSGRLEVQRNGQWSTIYDNKFVGAATVVCRMLNLGTENVFAESKGPVISSSYTPLVGYTCKGDEEHLNLCYMYRLDSYPRDIWISCA